CNRSRQRQLLDHLLTVSRFSPGWPATAGRDRSWPSWKNAPKAAQARGVPPGARGKTGAGGVSVTGDDNAVSITFATITESPCGGKQKFVVLLYATTMKTP